MIEPGRIANVMGGDEVLGRHIVSYDELEKAVEAGLPKNALRTAARRVFPAATEANRLIYSLVPEATYKRRQKRLRATESERTERLARVIASAEEMWRNREHARVWLTSPHPELAGRTPIECAKTDLGARKVEELLARIEYGLPV
jgi:putative toxin-antitoxin system antitoxin component (TIGR02293 family)